MIERMAGGELPFYRERAILSAFLSRSDGASTKGGLRQVYSESFLGAGELKVVQEIANIVGAFAAVGFLSPWLLLGF
jgi:hypothetical protein